MAPKGNSPTELDRDALYRRIAMHHTPLSRAALLTLFGQDDDTTETLDGLLEELAAESLISKDAHGYRAATPWADIAYAVVGPVKPGKRAAIYLENLDDAPGVTISQNDIKKHRLAEGQRIVVGLERGLAGMPADLRARFIAEADRPFHLVGTFNQKAQNFTPLDRSIKTEFKLGHDAQIDGLPHQFIVELPPAFDIRDPLASIIPDQTLDRNTGQSIGQIVASKHGIAKTHSAEALAEASNLHRRRLNFDHRTDLRHLDFVTVDPLGSTDLDDAFYAEVEKDGYAVYTAIADVAALVTHDSTVDREAYQRGSTLYMGKGNTVHMLPPILSTRKSSLIPGHNRPAIIVKQSLDWNARLIASDVFAGVIRSREQLSYGQFYDLLDGDDERFRTIARVHDMRRKNGDNRELESLLNENPGQYSSKSIIETLMVQSNSIIAQFLDAAGVPFLSRNFEQGENGKYGPVQRAYYATHHTGHANLGLRHYAHATSPIRRYADIINLRAVHKALGTPGIGISDREIENLDTISAHLNDRRRTERDVNHDMDKYHAIQDLARMQATPVRLYLNEIGADYIELTIVQTGLRQRLNAAALPANQWRIDETAQELVLLNQEGGEAHRYRQKDSLLGRIQSVDPARAQWKVRLDPRDNILRAPATGTGPKPA